MLMILCDYRGLLALSEVLLGSRLFSGNPAVQGGQWPIASARKSQEIALSGLGDPDLRTSPALASSAYILLLCILHLNRAERKTGAYRSDQDDSCLFRVRLRCRCKCTVTVAVRCQNPFPATVPPSSYCTPFIWNCLRSEQSVVTLTQCAVTTADTGQDCMYRSRRAKTLEIIQEVLRAGWQVP